VDDALTSPACEGLMNALEECHARGFMWKAGGNCNEAKERLMECLWAERQKRSAANREAAAKRKEEQEERLKKLRDELDS
jgi:COX assembly mitochondrial protein 2